MLDFFKNMKTENKVFYTFLAIHLIVWTAICFIRVVMPTDALEGIYWGSLHDFGTPKHPPMAGWLSYIAYAPFKLDFCIYLMSQLFILFGFIYTYKLARYFLDENKSMLSVIILEGCWCYSYITGYYGFNPDVILLFTLPAISYYFYNCITTDKKTDWMKLGLIVGFSFLNKYQTAMLIIPMALWALAFKRSIFKNIYFYLAILIAFVIFLPHLLWLIKYDFYPIFYFGGELSSDTWLNHITAPLKFFMLQMGLIVGSLLIFISMKLKYKSPFTLAKNLEKKDMWFLLLLGLGPIILHLIMGFLEGGTMRPRWGYEFWFMTGILLFYFFPTEIAKKEFMFTIKAAYVVMGIIFLALGTLLAVEKNYRSRYPVAEVFGDMKTFWAAKYNTPIKYVGGYLEWSIPITIYGDTHPDCLLDNFGYPSPWIKDEDLKKAGALIIDRTPDGVEHYTKLSCAYLPEDYKVEPVEYKFFVHNAFNMPRKYTIYYYMVPPMND